MVPCQHDVECNKQHPSLGVFFFVNFMTKMSKLLHTTWNALWNQACTLELMYNLFKQSYTSTSPLFLLDYKPVVFFKTTHVPNLQQSDRALTWFFSDVMICLCVTPCCLDPPNPRWCRPKSVPFAQIQMRPNPPFKKVVHFVEKSEPVI